MGFDKNDKGPLFFLRRWTTEVNLGMAIAVILFFALAGGVVWYFFSSHPGTDKDSLPPPVQTEVAK